jgi:uncharacterized membrane protein YeiH
MFCFQHRTATFATKFASDVQELQIDLKDVLYVIDMIGTFVFSISGVITSIKRKVDAFGAAVIGFVTALGGGTLRDVLIGSTPVGWMVNNDYLIAVGLGIAVAFFLRRRVESWPKTMFIFDTIGIGLFTILGLEKTLQIGLSPIIALMMGTVSAVFGGVVRDVLVNRIPLIFRREIYATACIAGGLVYLLITNLTDREYWPIFVSIAVVIITRRVAVMRKWSLPVPK